MRNILRVLVLACTLLVLFAAPVSAHVIQVTKPSGEPVITHRGGPFEFVKEFDETFGWVGGDGMSHGTGLITACETLRAKGNGVVDMWGPLNPATCPHG